jgi:hypothetical protein
MSLATYRDVRPWSRAIREELVEQRMPPTSAVRGYARLKDNIGLTPRELSTILTWVDGGVPRGDDSDLPLQAKTAVERPPDHRVAIPPQQIPGNGEDVVRRVSVETGLHADRWVRQLRVRPGDRRGARAAFVSILKKDGSRVWAGSWTPWQTNIEPAAPGAFFVPRGSQVEIELHYRGQDAPGVDNSSLAVFFAPEGQWRELTSLALTPAPSRDAQAPAANAEARLTRDSVLLGGRVVAAVEGTSVEITARRPDGTIEVLLWIPRVRAEWPAPFIFHDPVRLPAGTIVSVTTIAPDARHPDIRTILTLHSAN